MAEEYVTGYIRQLLAHEAKVNPTPYIKNGPNPGEILARQTLKADFTLFEFKVFEHVAVSEQPAVVPPTNPPDASATELSSSKPNAQVMSKRARRRAEKATEAEPVTESEPTAPESSVSAEVPISDATDSE